MDLPHGVKKVAEFSDGRCGLECRFCEGTGVFPKTDFDTEDDVQTEGCPVCKGSGIGVVAEPSDVLVWCRRCDASGRGWNDVGVFEGETCPACGGRGFLSLSALKLGQSPTAQADLWSLMHPDVAQVAKARFESGHFADAVEAAFKHFNSAVRERAGSRVTADLDGARLMNHVFSPGNPIIRLADLNTETGKNIQQGYMQMFAGGMTGIRNPKAHGNVTIDAKRAVHLLFGASLFLFKLDEAQRQGGSNEGMHPAAQKPGGG